MHKQYRNKKTGGVYRLVAVNVTNTTNENDGQKMFLYQNDKSELFVRDENEFLEKFEKIN